MISQVSLQIISDHRVQQLGKNLLPSNKSMSFANLLNNIKIVRQIFLRFFVFIFQYHNFIIQTYQVFASMFTLGSMQVLYKESALMESFITHKTKIKLLINNTRTLQTTQTPVQQRLAVWKNSPFPPIQAPAGINNVPLQFVFLKSGQEVGKAKSYAVVGRNRKDCLDIADRNFQIVGKFLYQINWKISNNGFNGGYNNAYSGNNVVSQNNYAVERSMKQPYLEYNENQMRKKEYMVQNSRQAKTEESYKINKSEYRPPDMTKPYFKKPQSSMLMQSKYEKKPVKQKSMISGMFGGCFGCFGPLKVKRKKPFFAIEPIVMNLEDLPYAAPVEQQYFSAQYYSKPLPELPINQ